ncbi:hypothetical protein NPIL_506731 [Nephila pilipes]|uniref:Uncharacterized protein n=1 Tax=Nephila pilipes TaxID=299642 RepID=A0A8X6Q6J4_NEPPI|nr:hypothetical protein NPIL_506731 [Nephila pilipes]
MSDPEIQQCDTAEEAKKIEVHLNAYLIIASKSVIGLSPHPHPRTAFHTDSCKHFPFIFRIFIPQRDALQIP